MDNATRRELLYKARAAGYPGSILDVYANYAQGRDLIAEFQQQQQLQQAQQMSDMAAQQVGMQQAPQQAPQQQMQQMQQQVPQMPVVPSSPTPAPNFTPPQPPAPIGVQSQDAPMGIVSGQSGPNQGRAIFATGGFTEEDPIKDLYAAYNKKKLEKITDPRTGKLLPTNDPRAQSSLREVFPGYVPKGRKPYTKEEEKNQLNKVELNYPMGIPEEINMFRENYDFPKEAANMGVEGLFESKYFTSFLREKGLTKPTKNPDYWKGNLTTEGKKWLELATSKYGMDPAVLGYYSGSSWGADKNENKTLADFDPSVLVESERYSKQPIISVGEFGDQLTWAPRKGDIMTNKNVADEEGQPRVVGATNMSGVDIPKKKKATGGFSGEGPGCPDGYFKDNNGNCVEILPQSDFRDQSYYDKVFGERSNVAGRNEYCKKFPGSNACVRSTEANIQKKDMPGFVLDRGLWINPIDKNKTVNSSDFSYELRSFKKFLTANKTLEQKPLTFKEFNNLSGGAGDLLLGEDWSTQIDKYGKPLIERWKSDYRDENEKYLKGDERKYVDSEDLKLYEGTLRNPISLLKELDQKSVQDEIGRKLEESKRMSQNTANTVTNKNVADFEGQPRVFGENVTADFKKIKIKEDVPYYKLSPEEQEKEDEIYRLQRQNRKKLGGVKCYTCVGRKRRV
jgi:hypothetical protein